MSSKVNLVTITPNAEELIAYCARVSSPNQDNPEHAKLLKYCATHGHWSVFEQADMTLEITTSRAIASQLLRHKSFNFQQFSLRYAEQEDSYEEYGARSQDSKNRQSSHDNLPHEVREWFRDAQARNWAASQDLYNLSLNLGIAKECARTLLPLGSTTKLYMRGSIRSWIHYCKVRCGEETQLEHRELANQAKEILGEQLPTIKELLDT